MRKLLISYDDGEKGIGWYVDFINNNYTRNIYFTTSKVAATEFAKTFVAINNLR